jgi:hypothetical protein
MLNDMDPDNSLLPETGENATEKAPLVPGK